MRPRGSILTFVSKTDLSYKKFKNDSVERGGEGMAKKNKTEALVEVAESASSRRFQDGKNRRFLYKLASLV